MNEISIEELKAIFSRIITKLEYESVKTIEFDSDIYRFVPTDEWSRFDKDVIEVGSLSDDIHSLKLVATNQERPCTYVDFDRLASVLRAISQLRNPV